MLHISDRWSPGRRVVWATRVGVILGLWACAGDSATGGDTAGGARPDGELLGDVGPWPDTAALDDGEGAGEPDTEPPLDDATDGALCPPGEAPSLDQLYDEVLSGCGRAGCHGTAAGGLRFSSAADFYAAVVDQPSTLHPGQTLVVPSDPAASQLYQVLLPTAPQRMPLGGGPLTDAQRASVAAWICEGAAPPL